MKIELDYRAAVTVVMASAGYPGNVKAGKKISGLGVCAKCLTCTFSMPEPGAKTAIFSSGGRVLAVTALGNTLSAARDLAYAAVADRFRKAARYPARHCSYRNPVNVAPTDAASRP